MSDQSSEHYRLETLAIRAGVHTTDESEHSEPIFVTSSYVFDSAAEAAARFSGEQAGNIYSRFTNPTVRNFEQRLCALEGGERCVATASGMAAILSTCLGILNQGDHIVSSNGIFGSTVLLFNTHLSRFGIETSYVEPDNLEQWEQAIGPNTRMLFLETPSNPLTQLGDISAIAELAHANNCLLVVDNCFCTPALQRPLEMGADIVVHSATKFIDGQGRCLGGAIVGSEELVGGAVYGFLRTAGPSLSPFNAWVFNKGLETLVIRMQAHSQNALQLAKWLEKQPGIEHVFYPGLTSHPQHVLARKQMTGFGAIVSFELKGGKTSAWKVIDATKMLSITANLGDTRTTITHPATTTHGRLTPEQRTDAGIGDGLVRLAVGLEHPDDIKADIQHGLAQLSGA